MWLVVAVLYRAVCAGSSEGSEVPELVAAFVAVPDLLPGRRGSGVVTAWQQDSSQLFAAGSSRMVSHLYSAFLHSNVIGENILIIRRIFSHS